ncbi:MAG: S8 family serine peptidase [Firmicutes bacterium]|nr:S8 family serine peptidase [Bacillota bacterium]
MGKRPRFLALMLVLTLLFSIFPTSFAVATTTQESNEIPVNKQSADNPSGNDLIVKFKPSTNEDTIKRDHKSLGAQRIGEIKSRKIERIRIPKGISTKEAIARYKKMPEVEYVEENRHRSLLEVPNDTSYASQWALPKISAPQAWDVTTGSSIIVAVVDTGVDYNHEDLAGKVIGGYDFFNDDTDPMDDVGHGTHVAGIIAAATNNGRGIAGVSWGAKILAVKVMDAYGGDDFTIAQGIRYAADNGAKIINLSLGGYGYSQTLADAISYAQGMGCLVVAAAGNDSTNDVLYPAGNQNVIGVSATNSSDASASFTNFGAYVDLAAPGENILSTIVGGYGYKSGTSMATPHVAGLAALVMSRYPGVSGLKLARILEETADDLGSSGRDDSFGYGRINAERAVKTSVTNLEESDANVVYTGNWNTVSTPQASGGTLRYSGATGDSASFSFYGTGVSWIARKGIASGIAQVYIDGVHQGNVDLYQNIPNVTDDYQQPVYTKAGLALGNHVIKIVVSGTKNAASSGLDVNIDAFDIISGTSAQQPPPPPAPAPAVAPDTTPPTPPTWVLARATGANYVYVSWGGAVDNVGVGSYLIERKKGRGRFIPIAWTSGTDFTDSRLSKRTVYSYRIWARDTSGNMSLWSSGVATTKTLARNPKPPKPKKVVKRTARKTVKKVGKRTVKKKVKRSVRKSRIRRR